MMLFDTIPVMTLFPITLFLLTLEIVLSSYKASSINWTLKLAFGNLVINVFWIALIIILLMNPLVIHSFLADMLAQIFGRSPEDISNQVYLIIFGIGFLSIISTVIDSFTGFKQSKTEKTKLQ